MALHKAFAIVRSRYDIDSRQIAKKTGLSIRSVQTYMSKGSNPAYSNIIMLCDAIGCTGSELLKEAEQCQ